MVSCMCMVQLVKTHQVDADSKNLLQVFLNEVTKTILGTRSDSKLINTESCDSLSLFDENEYLIEIFFRRKNTEVKILIERWLFEIVFDKGKCDKNNIVRKLAVIQRTINSFTRLLPAYSLFLKKGFNYELICNISMNDSLGVKNKFLARKRYFFEINSDLKNAKLNVKLEYILKSDIFEIEEQIVKYS